MYGLAKEGREKGKSMNLGSCVIAFKFINFGFRNFDDLEVRFVKYLERLNGGFCEEYYVSYSFCIVYFTGCKIFSLGKFLVNVWGDLAIRVKSNN